MPSRYVTFLEKVPDASKVTYKYCLWADVPATNQQSFRDFTKTSAYKSINDVELFAIQNGAVVETVGVCSYPLGTTIASIESDLLSLQTRFQTEVSAATDWADYGRYYNGASWVAGGTAPPYSSPVSSFSVLTPLSVFAANKFHFVLQNTSAAFFGSAVQVQMIVVLPSQTVVTGALSSDWTIQRREGLTTAPVGGALTPVSLDSSNISPATVAAFNAPTTAPAGGMVKVLQTFLPQADEIKLNGTDAPSLASIQDFGGMVVYNAARIPGCKPYTLRPNQTLEIVQGATAGTGNCKILVFFTA